MKMTAIKRKQHAIARFLFEQYKENVLSDSQI